MPIVIAVAGSLVCVTGGWVVVVGENTDAEEEEVVDVEEALLVLLLWWGDPFLDLVDSSDVFRLW